ncbi:MAG: hypothetical protein ABIF01_01150 [Candidatus Micrarchaeota archaeon]
MRKHHCTLLNKGQGAIEMVVLVGFFIMLSIPILSLFYLNASQSAQDTSIVQAKQSAREITLKADSVYSQGIGANDYIYVVFPQGLQKISARDREITFTVLASSGNSDIVSMGTAKLGIEGVIGTEAGPHKLKMRSLGDYVEISEG